MKRDKALKYVACPICNFQFSLLYSRAKACIGCRRSVLGCPYVRCPNCDHEIQINRSGITSSNQEALLLAREVSSFLKKEYSSFGERFG